METMKNLPGRRLAYFALGFLVLAWLVMDFNSRMNQLNRLEAEREIVEGNLVHVQETQVALDEAIAYARSDKIVEKYSYIDAHKKKPGDYPIILLPDRVTTPTPTPRPVFIEPEPENMKSWLWLFQDEFSP